VLKRTILVKLDVCLKQSWWLKMSNSIKRLRLARGWSQEQLAEICALSVRTIQRLENGDNASLETLSALAAAFEINVSELANESQPLTETGQAADDKINAARERVEDEQKFFRSLVSALIVCGVLVVINLVTPHTTFWFIWPVGIWLAFIVVKGIRIFLLRNWISQWKQRRIQRLLKK